MSILLSRKKILIFVFLFSVITRCVFFLYWLGSPFRYFHRIPGLDMETLLRFSEWGADKEFSPLFVLHRILIYLVWLVNGNEHCVPAIVTVQSLAGAAGAVMTADLVLMLWGKRKIALCAGVFYALYAPFLLYDFCILQESITTVLILAGVWGYVKCRMKHYPSKSTFSSGLLLGLCSIGRPVAALLSVILPVKTFFDGKRRAGFLLLSGLLFVWLSASAFNGFFSGSGIISRSFFPFFRAVDYTISFHTEKAASEVPDPLKKGTANGIRRMISGLPQRASAFFLAYEMPENINYYFLRSKLLPLKFLPGPGLLMPFALAGFFLLLLRLRHREFLIAAILILLAFPLAARDPIGRYRLHLIPYFILCAAYFFVVLQKNTRRIYLFCGAALVLSIGLNLAFGTVPFIRNSDHISWGRAIECADGNKPSAESCCEFSAAWKKSGHTDRSAAVNLIISSLRRGDMKTAVNTCSEGISGPAEEKSIYHYYLAVIAVSSGRFDIAANELPQIKESEIPELREKILHLRRIVQRKSL